MSVEQAALLEPVRVSGDEGRRPQPGVALCLSGGGYRAMLFHVGTLKRLNEFGWLPKLDRVSSVSGGSITAAVLATRWKDLEFDQKGTARNFDDAIIAPVRCLAGETIDVEAVVTGLLLFKSIGDRVEGLYRRFLFGDLTLQDLPDRPRFVINSTSMQTGALWRFSKPYMADYKVGLIKEPRVPVAKAVAASAGFPPVLSPVRLDLSKMKFEPGEEPLRKPPFNKKAILCDGGVYDNLGLETAWKRYQTILVSDAGAPFGIEGAPYKDWPRQALRVIDLIDNQVRSLRKIQLVQSYKQKLRQGAYWGINTEIGGYSAPNTLSCPDKQIRQLALYPTRLKAVEITNQERLINWGYAVCDAAMRSYVDSTLPPPLGFPYPQAGV